MIYPSTGTSQATDYHIPGMYISVKVGAGAWRQSCRTSSILVFFISTFLEVSSFLHLSFSPISRSEAQDPVIENLSKHGIIWGYRSIGFYLISPFSTLMNEHLNQAVLANACFMTPCHPCCL